jgi:hypothetical protein
LITHACHHCRRAPHVAVVAFAHRSIEREERDKEWRGRYIGDGVGERVEGERYESESERERGIGGREREGRWEREERRRGREEGEGERDMRGGERERRGREREERGESEREMRGSVEYLIPIP